MRGGADSTAESQRATTKALTVGERKTGLVALICLGYCLVLACSGCAYQRPRHGFIVRGDWSLELNRVPWLKGRPTVCQECSGPGEECTPACRPVPGCEEALPAKPAEEAPSPGQADSQIPWPPETDEASAAAAPGDREGICSTCGGRGLPLLAGVVPAGYIHPRFHPVPLQPVFYPAEGQAVGLNHGMGPEGGGPPPMPPREGTPRIEMVIPAPATEHIPPPKADSEEEDRLARVPRRVETASQPRSWIFSAPPNGAPVGTAEATSGADGQ